jgi:hypothetical protein
MSKKLLLAVLAGLVLAIAAVSQGFGQTPDADTDGDGLTDGVDRCDTTTGPAEGFGCPDADLDGVSDVDDVCPNHASGQGPDRDNNGCLEPISVLSYRYRFIPRRTGLRITRLRLSVITGAEAIQARWRCRGRACGGRIRRRGNTVTFRVTRRRLRPGTRIKIETRNRAGGGAQECFTFTVRRRGGPSVRARRAISLGVPSIRC